MKTITSLDYSVVSSRIDLIKSTLKLDDAAQAFTYAMLDEIYPTKSEPTSELITDGPGDMGIDAIYCRDHGNRVQVDIFSFKFRTSAKACNRNFEGNELSKIRGFLDDLLQKNAVGFSHANQALREKCEEIWSFFDSGKMCDFRIFLVSNGLPLAPGDRAHFEHFCKSFDRTVLEEIDFFAVVRLLSLEGGPTESAKLKAVDDQIFDRSDGDVRGVVANVEAGSLISAITDEGTGGIKRHLFNDNIRVYLGDDGGYNSDIIKSSLAEDNYLFWYLNNGITIVCDEVEYQKKTRGPIVSIRNFQVVNGAQTCNALYNAAKFEADKVNEVLILVKIYETRRAEIGQRVAISTNSQARINLRDLHANDVLQKKIESMLHAHGYFYERKKNQHIDQDLEHRVDALKLGQMLLSYIGGEPDKARTDSDSIFGSRYAALFNDDLNSEVCVSLIKVYAEIERRRDEFRLLQRRSVNDLDERRYLTYGHWYILFVVSLLCMRDGKKFPEESEVVAYIDEAQQVVASLVARYKSVAHYDMFRSSRLRDLLISEFGNAQLNLPFKNLQ